MPKLHRMRISNGDMYSTEKPFVILDFIGIDLVTSTCSPS